MAQISKRQVSTKVKKRLQDVLLQSITQVSDSNEALQFINNFLTDTEKVMLAKRLAIALLLDKGIGYRSISNVLKVSTTTILMVNSRLKVNKRNYHEIIETLKKDSKVKRLLSVILDSFEEMMVRPYSPQWVELKKKQFREKRKKDV